MNPFFKDFSEYMQEIFPGEKLQKISVNAGFSCPNRDGTISRGGCIYCLNDSFTPSYCMKATGVSGQLEEGIRFFSRKYPSMKYLAYFQSFTNTHAPISELAPLYEEAIGNPQVAGLIVGTRPDSLPDTTIELLSELNRRKPVFIELGAETSHDSTLRLINRGHDWKCVEQTVGRLTKAGLSHIGLHLICGLPGENEEDFLETIRKAATLRIESLKIHHLQVLKGTPLSRMVAEGNVILWRFSMDEYLNICVKAIGMIPRRICVERFLASAPPEMVESPRWGIKNFEFTNLILKRLKELQAKPESAT